MTKFNIQLAFLQKLIDKYFSISISTLITEIGLLPICLASQRYGPRK